MNIDSVLLEFVDVFMRSPRSAGKLHFSQSPTAVNLDVPYNDDLKRYFELVGFEGKVQIGGFFHSFLFRPDELIGALSGWRWIRGKNGELSEDPAWNPAWVIIGDRNGDAIFVNTEENSVYGSIQGENLLIAESLPKFFEALSTVMTIEMDKYRFAIRGKDSEPLAEFVDDVNNAISRILGGEASSGFVEFYFG